ncbi:MAG: cytochrome P450 [Solirubrobacterales bacterium]
MTDPPDHRRIRKAVQPHFTPQAVQAYEETVRTIANGLLDELEESPEPDLAHDFAWRIPVATVSRMLGFTEEERREVADILFELETREPEAEEQGDYFELPAVAREAAERLAGFISEQLAARRASPADDLLTELVQAEERGDLGPEETRGLTFILIMAGVDTTACLVGNGLHRLVDRPDDRRRIAEDPEFAARATEELVRWEAPVTGESRVALEDLQIAGGTIPEGARVWLCYAAANRDERRFEDPDRLDFERAPKRHIGFGEGIHHCIGAPLARLEGRIAFEEFFRRFDSYEIGSHAQRHHQHTTRGWTRLPAKLERG